MASDFTQWEKEGSAGTLGSISSFTTQEGRVALLALWHPLEWHETQNPDQPTADQDMVWLQLPKEEPRTSRGNTAASQVAGKAGSGSDLGLRMTHVSLKPNLASEVTQASQAHVTQWAQPHVLLNCVWYQALPCPILHSLPIKNGYKMGAPNSGPHKTSQHGLP